MKDVIHQISRLRLSLLFGSLAVAVVSLGLANQIVKSERGVDTTMSPYKFRRPLVPQKELPNIISTPTSAGDLDPTFGTGGKLTTDLSSGDFANAVAVQIDGKIVAAGTARVGNSNFPKYDFARYFATTPTARSMRRLTATAS